MTKQEIREQYLADIEDDIKSAERFADDPLFDQLRDVCDSPEGYSLFYPMTDGKLFMPSLAEIYGWLRYCWDDDGATSLVCATVCTPAPLRDFKGRVFGGDRISDVIFLMRGECFELRVEDVKINAIKHHPNGTNLVEYNSRAFYPKDLSWLHSMIPEFERVKYTARESWRDGAVNYFKAREKLNATMKEYICDEGFACNWTPSCGVSD